MCVCVYVCLCLSVSVCVSVCVCVKAMRFDIPAPIATELHTRTEDSPGKVKLPEISWELLGQAVQEMQGTISHISCV